MFYKTLVKDYIRVPPKLFNLPTDEAVVARIKKKFEGYISKEIGIVIDVLKVTDVREGIIISGDGASYYDTTFELLVFKPEVHEVVYGKIKDIADFGAFINIGSLEGMVHVSQTMDDFVSFAKDKVLTGKESKNMLKVGDKCKARIIAISFKDVSSPKIGLTMRQEFLGKLEWISDEKSGEKKTKKKA
ncbi:MAG: DNA-directed RNA polymerase [Candidatus Nanoarchaeia archaeon]